MRLTKKMKQMIYFIATELEWDSSRWIELTHEDNKRTVKALIDRGLLEAEGEEFQESCSVVLVRMTDAGLTAALSCKEPVERALNL